jgi:hypothetical protein
MNIGKTMFGEEGVLPRSWLPVSLSDQLDFHNLGVCEIQKRDELGNYLPL